jgi:hypothetical protein
MSTAPSATYTDSAQGGPSSLQEYIGSLISGGEISPPDAQTILVFYFPSSTVVTLDGAASCSTFGGYHNAMTAGGVTFPYAVIVECPPANDEANLTVLQEATFFASHEIVESATDPFQTATTLGFYLPLPPEYNDPSIFPWNNVAGGEAADMCLDALALGQDQTTESGFVVQRSWSNAAAAAGGDPCVPASSNTYFNVAPETWLLTMAVGQTKSFTADAFSTAPLADWTILGGDLNATQSSANPYLTITINGGQTATANNGSRVTVSVTLNQDPDNLAGAGIALGATGAIISTDDLNHPTQAHLWPFLVVAPNDVYAEDAGIFGADASAELTLRRPVKVSAQQLARFRQVFMGGRFAGSRGTGRAAPTN